MSPGSSKDVLPDDSEEQNMIAGIICKAITWTSNVSMCFPSITVDA